jgi:hypothetical protein
MTLRAGSSEPVSIAVRTNVGSLWIARRHAVRHAVEPACGLQEFCKEADQESAHHHRIERRQPVEGDRQMFGLNRAIRFATFATGVVAVAPQATMAATIPYHISRVASCTMGVVHLPPPQQVRSYSGAIENVYWEAVLQSVGTTPTYTRVVNQFGNSWNVTTANASGYYPQYINGFPFNGFVDLSYAPPRSLNDLLSPVSNPTFTGLAHGTYQVWNHYSWWTGSSWLDWWELSTFNNTTATRCIL